MSTQNDKIWNLEDYVNAHVPERFRYWILHQRGYADRFDWKGPNPEVAKQEKEQSIVEDWAMAVFREDCPFSALESCLPPLPDCQLIEKSGRKIGVEVTELVDQATIERNRCTSYHWKEYSESDLTAAVVDRLVRKNQQLGRAKDAIREAGFLKVIVILHCDEPDLISRPEFCRTAFTNFIFPDFSEIHEAFLLLPCPRKRNLHDLEAEFCQPIKIPLKPGTGSRFLH